MITIESNPTNLVSLIAGLRSLEIRIERADDARRAARSMGDNGEARHLVGLLRELRAEAADVRARIDHHLVQVTYATGWMQEEEYSYKLDGEVALWEDVETHATRAEADEAARSMAEDGGAAVIVWAIVPVRILRS